MLFDGTLIEFAPELTASSAAAAIIGTGDVEMMIPCQLPPALVVRAATLAGLAVIVIVFVMAEAVAKRAAVHISEVRYVRGGAGQGV